MFLKNKLLKKSKPPYTKGKNKKLIFPHRNLSTK